MDKEESPLQWLWMTAVSVAVGAAIGGITNALAIRMLFRPRRPWKIGNWTVPFTPGLIPKRKREIAGQMGKMVEKYLLTPQGIRRMLHKGYFQMQTLSMAERQIARLAQSKMTLRDGLETVFPRERVAQWTALLERKAKAGLIEWGLAQLQKKERVTVEELLPDEMIRLLEERLPDVTHHFCERLSRYLQSEEGKAMAGEWLKSAFSRHSFLHMMSGMLLRDPKMVARIADYLASVLKTDEVKRALANTLQEEWRRGIQKTLGDWVRAAGKARVRAVFEQWIASFPVLTPVLNLSLQRIFAPLQDASGKALVSALVSTFYENIDRHLEKLLDKVNLTAIVSQEVADFPLKTVEEMILNISGKEFGMIKLLGAVLGAMIGLLQAVIWMVLG